MPDESAKDQAPPPSGKRGKAKPFLIVALAMAVEGAGVYFLTNSVLSHPSPASAGEAEHSEPAKTHDEAAGKSHETVVTDELAEVALVDSRAVNSETGKLVVLQIRVSALVIATDLGRAQKLVEIKRARIEDRVNLVIRSAAPKHLNEPGLDTVKKRLKHEFDQIFDDEHLIREVLIPQMLQSGSGL